MHASRDIMAAFGELTAGSLTLGKYLKSFAQPLTFANFAVDDPMPAIVELPVAAWNRFAYRVTEAPKRTLAQKIARKLGIAPRRVAR
jgi:predicted ATP-grasp superfamily ATP-dependent carboligase